MAGAGFLYNDILARSGASPSLSHAGPGSSVVVDALPLSNVLDRRVAKVARILRSNTTSLTTTSLTFNLASYSGDKTVAGVMLAGFKYIDGTGADMFSTFNITAKLYSGPSTLVHSSGVRTVNVPIAEVPRVWVYLLPASVVASDHVTIDIAAGGAGATTGYLDIGRVFCSNGIVLPAGVDAPYTATPVDNSRSMRGRGQQIYTENMTRYRAMQCAVTMVPESIAVGSIAASSTPTFQLAGLQVGTSGEVVVAPRTGDSIQMQRLTVYGKPSRPLTVTHQGGGWYSIQIDVEEGL